MQIKYNPIIAIVFLILGFVNLLLGGWLLFLGEFSFSLLLGLLIGFIGVRYVRSPYFVVEARQVVIPALIGSMQRTYTYDAPAGGLKVENGKLYHHDGEQWKQVPVQKWLTKAKDWELLKQKFGTVTP